MHLKLGGLPGGDKGGVGGRRFRRRAGSQVLFSGRKEVRGQLAHPVPHRRLPGSGHKVGGGKEGVRMEGS